MNAAQGNKQIISKKQIYQILFILYALGPASNLFIFVKKVQSGKMFYCQQRSNQGNLVGATSKNGNRIGSKRNLQCIIYPLEGTISVM